MTRRRNYVVRIAFKDFAGWKCKPVLADFLEIGAETLRYGPVTENVIYTCKITEIESLDIIGGPDVMITLGK